MIRSLTIAIGAIFLSTSIFCQDFDLYKISTYYTGTFDASAAEIAAHDPGSQLVFFTNADANSVVVLDISNPDIPRKVAEISQAEYGAGVNSVDVYDGLVAVAVEAEDITSNGMVTFWNTDGSFITSVEVGVLPDMLTFSNDGTKILVANEGQPSDDYMTDPEGSVSLIDLSNGAESATVKSIGFTAFEAEGLKATGVRVFGPGATAAQDLEPEYIAFSDDDLLAYIICQENNAVAILDIETETITDIIPLGTKDYSQLGNSIDASNRDDKIDIKNHEVLGFYMPDAVDYATINGKGYLFTANEGDARDYDGYSEEVRVKDLTLDAEAFPNAAELQADEELGRLKTTTADGDTDGDRDVDVIYAYGGRSFSIWDASTGEIVFDSGNEFEQYLAQHFPENFNSSNDESGFDDRSDDKGPEPEAIKVAFLNDRVYALIGLERMGGIFVYDVTNVHTPKCVFYINNRNFNADPESQEAGDLGVEDVDFIPADESPTGYPMVVTANEVSGTVTFFSVNERNPSFDPIFDEEIDITSYETTTVVMPPSPLETQVVFIGGYDIVQTTKTYGNPAGQAVAKEWHDFIGFTPDETEESTVGLP